MAYQGKLDGLCGQYAIVNAYNQCGLNEEWLGQDLFNIACSAIDGWPDIMWEGTSFSQLRKMLRTCQRALRNAYKEAGEEFHLEVETPFVGKKRPRSNREYWMRFEELHSCSDVVCGILGMEQPHEHWITFENRRKSLSFFDSDATGARWRIEKREIHAGRRYRRRYLVNRRELVVFRSNVGG